MGQKKGSGIRPEADTAELALIYAEQARLHPLSLKIFLSIVLKYKLHVMKFIHFIQFNDSQ